MQATLAGGMIASLEDVTQWVRALFSGKVLPQKQFNEMTSLVCTGGHFGPADPTYCPAGQPLPPNTQKSGGFGFGLIRFVLTTENFGFPAGVVWTYGGDTNGYMVAYYYIKNKDTIISIAGNIKDDSLGNYAALFRKIYSILYGA